MLSVSSLHDDINPGEQMGGASGYTLFPVYEKEKTDRTGLYRVRNTVIVESKDLGKVGAFIDQAAEAGVSRISDLTFTRDKSEEIAKEPAATPISVGEIQVQAIVQVVFELNWPVTQ